MIGRNPTLQGTFSNYPLDRIEGPINTSALYNPANSIPWFWQVFAGNASPASYGRGITNVSNKVSEHNIYNVPIYFVRNQLPAQSQAPQTRKIISRPLPAMGISAQR